jgi:CBS domain containing-hemolysin-like protein
MNETEHSAAAAERPAGEDGASADQAEGPSTAELRRPEQASLLERLRRFFPHRNGSSLREDLADALAESAPDAAAFSPGERAMLKNILRLREVRVEDVMVPRADIKAVELSTRVGDLLALFEDSGHSRMPVYG